MVIRTSGSNLRSVDFAIDRSALFPGQRFLLFLFLYHSLQIVRAVDMETDGPADEDVEPERENSSRQSIRIWNKTVWQPSEKNGHTKKRTHIRLKELFSFSFLERAFIIIIYYIFGSAETRFSGNSDLLS